MLELRFSWLQQPLLVQHRNTAGVAFKSVWWTVKTKAKPLAFWENPIFRAAGGYRLMQLSGKHIGNMEGWTPVCLSQASQPPPCSLVGYACSLQERTHSRISGFYPLRCQHKIILKILPGTVIHPLGGNSQSRTTDLIYIQVTLYSLSRLLYILRNKHTDTHTSQ